MENKQIAVTLNEIKQSPELVPNSIPKGVTVEVIREIEHKDFFSGKGYIIFWEEKAYSDVVDTSAIKFV